MSRRQLIDSHFMINFEASIHDIQVLWRYLNCNAGFLSACQGFGDDNLMLKHDCVQL